MTGGVTELTVASTIDVVKLITAEELAAILGCSASHVYEIAARGDIPSMKIGRLVRFELDSVLIALRLARGS